MQCAARSRPRTHRVLRRGRTCARDARETAAQSGPVVRFALPATSTVDMARETRSNQRVGERVPGGGGGAPGPRQRPPVACIPGSGASLGRRHRCPTASPRRGRQTWPPIYRTAGAPHYLAGRPGQRGPGAAPCVGRPAAALAGPGSSPLPRSLARKPAARRSGGTQEGLASHQAPFREIRGGGASRWSQSANE
jgi:hypothetical protein